MSCLCFSHHKKKVAEYRVGTASEIQLGPMRLKQHTMSIMLVFAKEDAQSDGFWWASDKAGYKCNIARNSEGALECYLDKHHDVVIIDHRHSKGFDAEALCRSIRATKSSKHTIIIAVTKKHPVDKEEPSILPLLQAGFNRRFIENHNVGACLNELISIEHGEVRAQLKLRACDALFAALENTSDAVEILSKDHIVQYVNPAYETLMGYTLEELLGKDVRQLPKSDKNKPDLQEGINSQLKKGKPWEGTYYIKRKNGEQVPNHCHVLPVEGQAGKVRHYVAIRNPASDNTQIVEKYKDSEDPYGFRGHDFRTIRKGSYDLRSISSTDGAVHSLNRRRESVARIHSMTIEAPITKVINIINAAQENSPLTVVQALDKVLEILRTTELYSPHLSTQQVREEDQMTSDLVGGLMSSQVSLREESSVKRRHSTEFGHKTNNQINIPQSPVSMGLSQVPEEAQIMLMQDQEWEFDIIRFEKLTSKRPLVYLGHKIFTRFGACEFLSIDEQTLHNWLQLIEANYHSSNTYHNSTHAADVLHSTAYLLDRERMKSVFDQMDAIASLIAATIHDVDHPGKTNSFLVNAGDELAFLYNDLAVLESHHAAMAFQITVKDDRVNIFKNMEKEEFRTMRRQIIDMVLATEMTKHFEHLSKFVNCTTKVSAKSDDEVSLNGPSSPTETSTAFFATQENKTLIKRMIIKCSDVSNPTRPLPLCKEWAIRIAEEYFVQTDEEKAQELPVVMPIFDRKTCSIPKSQISFIDFFINEMFDALDAFADVPVLITYLQNNYKYWKEEADQERKRNSVEIEPLSEDERL